MVHPEISTVLDSGAAPQHDGIFAFGCTILEVDVGERGSPSFISSRIYILLCDGFGFPHLAQRTGDSDGSARPLDRFPDRY